ncbi:MAG TPA: zinc ribbon domain-containing protein [Fimbriiglobus sp.]|nr:zinc ribbon domain-containing protein [Fimbriiglobus sp.]
MSDRVQCQNCGGRVNLPDGYARAKIRCPGCGYYADVPAELRGVPDEGPAPAPVRAAPVRGSEPAPAPPPKPPTLAIARKAKPQPNPRDTRPFFDPGPGGKPLLEGTQEEHDDEVRPYAVPGTGLKKCPHCRGDLPLDSTFCVHCGQELTSGAKAVRTFQPINRTWHEGWPPFLRLQIFIAFQVVNAVAAVLLIWTGGGMPKDFSGFATLLVTNLFQVGMQAFLVGSYDALTVKRTAKGQATLTRTRRVAFFPLPPTKLPWRQSTNVGIAGADIGLFPKLLCLYFLFNSLFYVLTGVFYSLFLLGLAVIYFAVGVGFYWLVLRPNRFEVNLCDVYGSTDEIAFRSQDRTEAEEVATTVAEATGLFYKPAQ